MKINQIWKVNLTGDEPGSHSWMGNLIVIAKDASRAIEKAWKHIKREPLLSYDGTPVRKLKITSVSSQGWIDVW